MEIRKDTVVTMDYTLKDSEGAVLDTSQDRGPLTYLHGAGNLIPGLESALEGKTEGEHVETVLPPEDAYGERDEGKVFAVPREKFQGVDDIEPGMQFQAQIDGQGHIITVQEAGEESVTVDANHPLAGMQLTFQVDVRDIREATTEELSNGLAESSEDESSEDEE